MKVIYGIGKIKSGFIRPVVTIGIFDGVHRGHQFIIKKVIKKAREINGTSVVLTFDPHPVNILRPKSYLPLLVSLEHRIELIKKLGVDVCIVEPFSHRFSEVAPEEFIKKMLVDKIRPCVVFIGSGFTFGSRGAGDIGLLEKLGREYNFEVDEIAPIRSGKAIISSTLIRRLVREGNLTKASSFLGRKVSILGKVIPGRQKGRLLGYPTANISSSGEVIPQHGIYITKIAVVGKKLNAVTYIGSRPTYKNEIRNPRPGIEVHILNFKRKIYGQNIEIEFLKKIRDEKRFPSQEVLRKQIENDLLITKKFFKTR